MGNEIYVALWEVKCKAGVYKLDDAMKIQKAINNSEVKSIKYYNYVGK